MDNYEIKRPPLTPTFELPSRKELLALQVNDHVKLIFEIPNTPPERMWVVVTDCSDSEIWEGTIDNKALSERLRVILPPGEPITFHPLDIIQTLPGER